MDPKDNFLRIGRMGITWLNLVPRVLSLSENKSRKYFLEEDRERTLGTRGCIWPLDVRVTGRPGIFSLPNQDGGPGTRSLLHYKTGF